MELPSTEPIELTARTLLRRVVGALTRSNMGTAEAPCAALTALTLGPALDALPFDVLVQVLLACDTTSVCRLASASWTLARCCETGRVWEAVWRRQFGGIWELERDSHITSIPELERKAKGSACDLSTSAAQTTLGRPLLQMDARTAATKAREWLRTAAGCRRSKLDLVAACLAKEGDEVPQMSDRHPTRVSPGDPINYRTSAYCDWHWLGLYDDRGHLCYCKGCLRPYAVTVRPGFVDTPQFSSKMVMKATFRAINEAPAALTCFEHTWDGFDAQKDAKDAMRYAMRWPRGVCELDADGRSVHASKGFPAGGFGPTRTGTWANWPDAQN